MTFQILTQRCMNGKNTISGPFRVQYYLYVTFQILAERCMNGIKCHQCTFQSAMLPLCDVLDFGRKVHEWKNIINAPLRVLNYLYVMSQILAEKCMNGIKYNQCSFRLQYHLYVTFQILTERCMNGIKYHQCTFYSAKLPLCDVSDFGRKVHEWNKIPLVHLSEYNTNFM